MSSNDVTTLTVKLRDAEYKLEKSCSQIVLIDNRIRDLDQRYKRAVASKKNSFRYNLRLRLSVATGVKMMYHHYIAVKAEEIRRLQRELEDLNARIGAGGGGGGGASGRGPGHGQRANGGNGGNASADGSRRPAVNYNYHL